MNFAGYVPLNRGLIEHTMTGSMTNNEALVFVWLLMLADHKTGGYSINQPTLRTFLPELSKWAAQDALEELERKRYIYRDVKPHSRTAYRYWVHGFAPTAGPHKDLHLDLSEVFATRDPSRAKWSSTPVNIEHLAITVCPSLPEGPPEPPPEGPSETPPEGPKSNKKEKEKEIKKEKTSSSTRGDAHGERDSDTESDERSEPVVNREVSGWCAEGETNGEHEQAAPLPEGYVRRKGGHEGPGIYSPNGSKLSDAEVKSILRGYRLFDVHTAKESTI